MIKVQLLTSSAKPPIKVDPAAVGWDVFADSVTCDGGMLIYSTGIAVEPPEGYFFALYPRSSQSKTESVFGNSVGIVEPEYRGPIEIRLRPTGNYEGTDSHFSADTEFRTWQSLPFQPGDRIAQLVLHKKEDSEIQIVDKLNETARGSKGFGGFTGK